MTAAVATVGVTASLLAGGMHAASASEDLNVPDARRDAHRAIDITRVVVSHTSRAVRVVVTVRDFVAMDSGARVPTALGVHFDTRGTRKPNHLIKIDGMHVAAGSTWDWNKLRSNGMDPWGDWGDCFPRDWDKPLIRSMPKRNKVAVVAPRRCLGDPGSVRVAVQSYRPYRSDLRQDWAKGRKNYLPRVQLG
jgi:hypothetical protein